MANPNSLSPGLSRRLGVSLVVLVCALVAQFNRQSLADGPSATYVYPADGSLTGQFGESLSMDTFTQQVLSGQCNNSNVGDAAFVQLQVPFDGGSAVASAANNGYYGLCVLPPWDIAASMTVADGPLWYGGDTVLGELHAIRLQAVEMNNALSMIARLLSSILGAVTSQHALPVRPN